jgi:hypothetical protein
MSRYEKFAGSSKLQKAKKSKGTRKEAAKVLEYTATVERALQAAEILQAARQAGEQARREMLREAGLVEVLFCSTKLYCIVPCGFPSSQKPSRTVCFYSLSRQLSVFLPYT